MDVAQMYGTQDCANVEAMAVPVEQQKGGRHAN
jgi:hypothetical protein